MHLRYQNLLRGVPEQNRPADGADKVHGTLEDQV